MLKKFLSFVLFFVFSYVNQADAQFVSREAEEQARGSLLYREPQPEPQPAYVAPQNQEAKLDDDDLKILFIVNGEIVTTSDLNNRIRAFLFTTKIPFNSETKNMIVEKIKQNTIDEKIKVQEAEKENIIISEKEIDMAIDNYSNSIGLDSASFIKELEKNNVSIAVIRDQMKSDLSWIRLLRQKGADETRVGQRDIAKAIAALKKNSSVKKYRLSEIVVSKNNNKNIQELVSVLRQDPRFELYAMQFSEAPSASNGGNLGWVDATKLSPAIASVVKKMSEKSVSDPISVGRDYYIIRLERIYDPSKDKIEIPSEEQMKKDLEEQKMEEFANSYINKLRQKSMVEIKN